MKINKSLLKTLLTLMLIASVFLVSAPLGHAQTDQDWSEPVNISNSGSAYDPQLIVDLDGAFHIIWFDLFDGYKYTESADGTIWTEPKNVKFPFSPPKTLQPTYSIEEISQPRFIVDSKGAIHVFWQDEENNLYHSKTLSTQLDNPAAWNGSITLSNSVVDFDVEFDTYGNVHLTYLNNLGTGIDPAGIYYRKFDGVSWSTPMKLYASQYFRSLQPEDIHVSIALSSDTPNGSVYVVWDNPFLKRILMAVSTDLGKNWMESLEVVIPDEKSGYETPYNAEIDVVGNKILLMWKTGQSENRCAQYSRWSDDGGTIWGETMKLFGDLGICPAKIGFDVVDDEYSVMLFKAQEGLVIVAWDGNRWSDLQFQNELSAFRNSTTLDPILFGCQQVSIRDNMLFVVGCDEGDSKDIWFTSRVLGSIEDWFPPPSAWSSPSVVTRVSYKIPSVSSTVDGENNIHAVWVPLSISEGGGPDLSIYYAVWNKIEWSRPIPIIINLNGSPNQLSLGSDNQGRLLLVWVDETNQNLMFSWANSSRANVPLEWNPPIILPVPTKLVSSPVVLTDGADNIVVAYSVPFNENRGIYIVRSANLGKNWSAPLQVFDAVSTGWDSIDQPRIAITGDGRLHLLFTRFSMMGGSQPMGLYYSQSADGGIRWNDPKEISDGRVSWSNIIAYGNQALYLLWQEKIGEETFVYHQVSTDNGQTWGNPIVVSSTNKKLIMSSSTMDVGGQLHLLQISSDKTLNVQELMWNGLLWKPQETVELSNDLDVVNIQTLSAGVTTDGYLYAITFIESKDTDGNQDNRLISFGRFVDVVEPNLISNPPILPTPVSLLVSTAIPDSKVTPTASLLADMNDAPPVGNKNVIGFFMIAVIVVFVVIIIRSTRSSKQN